ncbi:hypothetical protein M9H77_23704 [Catharanthus roseus]|uniref:Uncharacterized protein n=1 Tax=Catharanthus roseus TaxID=4058 RepID=A0ACC0AY52_CATRO|nr:hypothetical protein M9H77_23704 [Catharanthus roseus]
MGWDGLIVYSISNDQNITLSVVPSVEDVKNTLFSFINEKSPSPNGTTLSVYKAYWPIVGELRIDSFNWSAFEWFEVLLDCNNDFPSSSEHKNELLTYAMVVLETMWMMRNRAIHGRVIPDWKELSDHIGRKADGYWEAGREERCDVFGMWSRKENVGDSFGAEAEAAKNLLSSWDRIQKIVFEDDALLSFKLSKAA